MLSPYHPFARIALVVAIAISACLFIAVASQTFPFLDDFCRAAGIPATALPPQVFPVGLTASLGWTYQHWQGRWVPCVLETILLRSSRTPELYPWLLILLTITDCGLLYAAVQQICRSKSTALFYSGLFILV